MHSSNLVLLLLLLGGCNRADELGSKPVEASERAERSAPTAIDQSNEPADLDHLAAIRTAVVQDDTLSVEAQNTNILARSGHVILRGKVPTTWERSRVEELARQCVATKSVENQIEVDAQ
jgi:hyperosmotically inducible periplasmic protein